MSLLNNPDSKKPGIIFLAGYSIVFFLFGLTGILHHEMWLDEMHHWLLAEESFSLRELFFNMKFEGHPPLWNIILFILTRFFDDPFSMQFTHIMLATFGAMVFFYYAPFSLLFKTGVLSGYFIFYEFNIISRNYAVGILLVWIICTLFSKSKKNYLLLCILTGLLANVHLFFLFISLSLFIFLISDTYSRKSRISWITGILFYLAFLLCAVKFIIPPVTHFLNHYNVEPVLSFNRIERAGSVFIRAFLHIPDFTSINCWNSNFFLHEFRLYVILPALAFIFVPFIILYKNRVSLFIFYFPSILTAVFLYVSPLAMGVRYFGLIYISFLIALWIQKTVGNKYEIRYYSSIDRVLTKSKKIIEIPFMIILFSTQIISSVIMFSTDFNNPFSQAKKTADFLKSSEMERSNIAVSNIAAISAFGGYIPKMVYSVEAELWCKFSPWNVFPYQCSESELIKKLENLELYSKTSWILVTNHLLVFNKDKFNPRINYEDDSIHIFLVKSFTGSIVSTENYFIYKVEKFHR